MKRGDVVIIDFPYSDRTGGNVRPSLVVQSDTPQTMQKVNQCPKAALGLP